MQVLSKIQIHVRVCVCLTFNCSARNYFIYNKQVNIAHPKCDFSTFVKEP